MTVSDRLTRVLNIVLSAVAVLAIVWAGVALPGEQREQRALLEEHERRLRSVEAQPAVIQAELRSLRDQVSQLREDMREVQRTQLEMFQLLRNGDR
jgi:Tfp pilus assembly protein PilO